MYNSATLILDILDFWHIGSGQGKSFAADAVMLKDGFNLPYLPGRTLKGLLREAVRSWNELGHFKSCLSTLRSEPPQQAPYSTEPPQWQDSLLLEELLFGSEGNLPGALTISDAVLHSDIQHYLKNDQSLTQELYRNIYNTAINENGVAQPSSLRAKEVAIPMVLYSTLQWQDYHAHENNMATQINTIKDEWQQIITKALPLLTAFGANRNRGYGRVSAKLEGDASCSCMK